MSLLPLVLVWSASVSDGCLKNSSLQSAHMDFIFFPLRCSFAGPESSNVCYCPVSAQHLKEDSITALSECIQLLWSQACACCSLCGRACRLRQREAILAPYYFITVFFWQFIQAKHNVAKTRLKIHFRNTCPRRRPRAEGQRTDGSTLLITEASCHRLFDFNV